MLISTWHLESLVLRDLAPNIFTSLQPLHDTYYLSDIIRQGLRYTTCLAHTFLECVKKKMPTRLHYLDLTGFPTGKNIVYVFDLPVVHKCILFLQMIINQCYIYPYNYQ